MSADLISPMLALMLLTLIVWVIMFARRIPFLNSLEVDADSITPQLLAEKSPATVSNPSDNLKNLFELPVLFYALCLYLHFAQQTDLIYTVCAWIFVLFRYGHSFVHCTINKVMVRFTLYLIAALSLWFMLLRAAWTWLFV